MNKTTKAILICSIIAWSLIAIVGISLATQTESLTIPHSDRYQVATCKVLLDLIEKDTMRSEFKSYIIDKYSQECET